MKYYFYAINNKFTTIRSKTLLKPYYQLIKNS